MKIAPNLNFTVVEPTKKSLQNFVQMIKTIYQNYSQAFNGQIGFGDGTNLDNINGSWINVTAPVAPNTDFTVTHNLGRVPSGYWIMEKDRACDVYTGSVAPTSTQLTLRATVASAVLRLFIVGILLSFFSMQGYGQGASHTNVAQKTTTVAGSTGIGGGVVLQPIAGAVITVCNGSTLPVPGSTCTGLASIYSNVALTNALSNPTNADSNGNYTFFAASGLSYVISVASTGLTTYSYVWTAPPSLAGNLAFSGIVTFTGTLNCKNFEGNYCVDAANNQGWAGANGGAQIATAISTANAAGGGTVFIMPGNYNVTANIALASNVRVECPGGPSFTTLTWGGGTGPNAIFLATNVNDWSVKNCGFVGPNATTAGTSDIRGVEVDLGQRWHVTGNKITGMSYGIFSTAATCATNTSDAWIEDNWLKTMTTQGIVTCGNNFVVRNNRIDTIGTTSLHQGIYVSGSVGAIVESNAITNTAGFCIQVFTSTASVNNDDVRVIGNSCNTNGTGTGSTNGAIVASFSAPATFCHKIVIVSNTVDTATGNNNDIGVQIAGCTESVVSGNVIKNVANHGIYLSSATSDSIASSNRVKDYNANGGGASGVVIAGGGLRNIVADNVISASNSTGSPTGVQISAIADSDNVVSNNDVINNTNPIIDNGARTLVYGNKVNNTDALFRMGAASFAEITAPTGIASLDLFYGDSSDHYLYKNENNSGATPVGHRAIMSSPPYTNATTTPSNIPGLAFVVAANRTYVMSCSLMYQGSAGTAGLDMTITGPAAPTSIWYSYIEEATSTGGSQDSVANAFGTKLTGAGTITATTNFPATVKVILRNGANAGTVQLQGSASGAGTVTVQDGFCILQ